MRAIALALVVAITACYSPQLARCTVRCGSDSPCPADLTCGTEGLCHAAGDTAACDLTLDIQVGGNGAGEVRSTPAGVDCTSDSTGAGCDDIPFPAATMIELTESHSGGNTFAGWSGDACAGSTTATCTFVLSTSMMVGATFN